VTTSAEIREHVSRCVVPRLALGIQEQIARAGEARARIAGLLGQPPSVELYIAFDDPYSALALVQLAPILRRRGIVLALYPLVERGISEDPDLSLRKTYAIQDSRRLARRAGLVLRRSAPISPHQVAFLAEWTEAARGSPGMEAFAVAAMNRLWLTDGSEALRSEYALLYETIMLRRSPDSSTALRKRLVSSTKRLRRKGHYETPAARVAGEWFFAHERIPQMETRFDELGWAR
jgi:2-hydroxychromene-2-carboxylate isomerase